MTKHTPGPWAIAEPTYKCLVTAGENGLHIAQAATVGTPNCEANARLIATAPEMLDALRDIVSSSNANCGDSLANAIQRAMTVIDKATINTTGA